MINTFKSTCSILALAVGLSACGGGSTYVPRTTTAPTTTPTTPPTPQPPSTPTTTVSSFRTQEFNRQWGLGAVKAEYAYQKGYTGDGVTVAFVDFNFDFSSTEIDFHPASKDKSQEYVDMYEAQTGQEATTTSHGEATITITAAKKNGVSTHGVAYDAQIMAIDFFSGVNMTEVEQDGVYWQVSNPYVYAMRNGARIVNISLGWDEEDIIEDPPAVAPSPSSGNVEKYYVDTPAHVIDQGGLLVVSAGNSDPAGDPDPQLSIVDGESGIIARATEVGILSGTGNAGGLIIAGAVDQNNEIADFSDKAGDLVVNGKRVKDFYLVAPGVDVVFPWGEGPTTLYEGGGTSFAAPFISGAAAIVMQRWPSLSAWEVAEVLFESATDLGAPGTDNVFGRGLLNLQAAMEPIGQTTSAAPDGISVVPISGNGLVLPPAFGDAMPKEITNVMGLDKFGRDFYFDLSSNVDHRGRAPLSLDYMVNHRMNVGNGQWQFGENTFSANFVELGFDQGVLAAQSQSVKSTTQYAEPISFFAEGKLNENLSWQAGTGFSVSNVLEGNANINYDTLSLVSQSFRQSYLGPNGQFAALNYSLSKLSKVSFGVTYGENKGYRHPTDVAFNQNNPSFGWVSVLSTGDQSRDYAVTIGGMIEKDGILGARALGNFGLASSAITNFVGASVRQFIGEQYSFEAKAKAGLTNTKTAANSLFAGLDQIITSEWAMTFTGDDGFSKDGSFALSLSQPLRVEKATGTMLVGTGLDAQTGIPQFRNQFVSFAPNGRELALEAAWRTRGKGWAVETSLMHRKDAGHFKGLSDTAGLVRMKFVF